jgi:hypothetical protein
MDTQKQQVIHFAVRELSLPASVLLRFVKTCGWNSLLFGCIV